MKQAYDLTVELAFIQDCDGKLSGHSHGPGRWLRATGPQELSFTAHRGPGLSHNASIFPSAHLYLQTAFVRR